MALSNIEIQRIHSKRLAKKGVKYYSNNNEVYIGTEDGRLEKFDKASQTRFKSTIDVQEDNVQKAIENLSDKVKNDVVKSLNTLKGDVIIKQGTNVVISQSGQEITITFSKPADIIFDDTNLVKEDITLQQQIDDMQDLFKRLLIDISEQGFEFKDEQLLIKLEEALQEITEIK